MFPGPVAWPVNPMHGRVLSLSALLVLGITAIPALLDQGGLPAAHLQFARVAAAAGEGVCVGAYQQSGNNSSSCTGVWVGYPDTSGIGVLDGGVIDAIIRALT